MEPQPITEPKKPSSLPLIILIILLLFSLAASGFLYYQNRQLQQQILNLTSTSLKPNDAPQSGASPTPTVAADPTTSWQTFTNTSMAYSLKLPANWHVIEHSSNFPNNESYASTESQRIDIALTDVSPLDCKGDCPIISTQSTITLSNQNANKIEGYVGAVGGEIPHEYITITTSVGKKHLNLTFHPSTLKSKNDTEIVKISSEEKALFTQILSTFKLTPVLTLESFKTECIALRNSSKSYDETYHECVDGSWDPVSTDKLRLLCEKYQGTFNPQADTCRHAPPGSSCGPSTTAVCSYLSN